MTPEEEIKELDSMVNERNELIFLLSQGERLNDHQTTLLRRIVDELTPF